jgi:hypothetical protein
MAVPMIPNPIKPTFGFIIGILPGNDTKKLKQTTASAG